MIVMRDSARVSADGFVPVILSMALLACRKVEHGIGTVRRGKAIVRRAALCLLIAENGMVTSCGPTSLRVHGRT